MQQSKLIAIVGGSGAGKTWLARRLEQELSPNVSRLSLDDFYCDRATVPPSERASLNYDHPSAIDWEWFESVLRQCREGNVTRVPRYSYITHTRILPARTYSPGRIVLVEGLWLLVKREIRELFDYSVYLDCPLQLRLDRRIDRDLSERGREASCVQAQFWKSVAPMHDSFVAPQAMFANLVLGQPSHRMEIESLVETIRALGKEDRELAAHEAASSWTSINDEPAAKPILTNYV